MLKKWSILLLLVAIVTGCKNSKEFRQIKSFSEFPYYNVGDITSAKGYPHYDWPATYSVSLFINNLYTVTSLIVKLVTKRRKSNNQIVLNCLHQHNLMTIE